MFIFLLALGEDYNILVMTRITGRGVPATAPGGRGPGGGATGPTVTSAGLVLAGHVRRPRRGRRSGSGGSQVRAIGVGLAVGILLDTFVVRTLLVPSTVALLGRWNWWPSAMGRRHRDEPIDSPPAPALRSPVTTGPRPRDRAQR